MNIIATPLLVLVVTVPLAIAIPVTMLWIRTEVGLRMARFHGPAQAGTGTVLAAQQTGSSVRRGGHHPPAHRCRIALHVDVPGHEPYDAEILQLVDDVELPNLRPGSDVAVQVDSSDPHNIHLDFQRAGG